MSSLVQLNQVFTTPKGKLRASLEVNGQKMTVRWSEKTCSFISTPVYHTSFEVCGIDLDAKTVTLRTQVKEYTLTENKLLEIL